LHPLEPLTFPSVPKLAVIVLPSATFDQTPLLSNQPSFHVVPARDGAGAAAAGTVVRTGCWDMAGATEVAVDWGAWLVQPLFRTERRTRHVQKPKKYFIGTQKFVILNKYNDLIRE
jgi:hypothetical protein